MLTEKNMTNTREMKCGDFIKAIASSAPTPGGGGGAAFGGALGMALVNMVGNLTLGKKKYANVELEAKKIIQEGDEIISAMMDLIDADAAVFAPLAEAYCLPKETPEQIAHKKVVMEKCSKDACEVPMQIMRKAHAGILLMKRMGEIGTSIAISDVGCGVTFMKSALIASYLNVLNNLNSIKDQSKE